MLFRYSTTNKSYSLGLSQEKLAFLAGIDRTYMSEIERELANPSIEVLLKISNALDLSPQDLLKA
uniref:helix-turn-helix domain-containing protein n=1 Tax=Polynucleobacter sp. TaxID=2029855 RepID=UPI0040478A2F